MQGGRRKSESGQSSAWAAHGDVRQVSLTVNHWSIMADDAIRPRVTSTSAVLAPHNVLGRKLIGSRYRGRP